MRTFITNSWFISAPAALLALLVNLVCAAPVAADERFQLRMGYMGSVYQEMTNSDIKAAVSVLIKKIAWKNFGKSEARYFDSITDLAKSIKAGTVQVACLPPEQYMDLKERCPIEPLLVTTTSSSDETELLLLVRKDSGIRSLQDLRRRTLVMPPQRTNKVKSLFRLWIETLLLRQGDSNVGSYFSSIKETMTTVQVIMPVFFRQADACVVTRHVFELTAELNPQINSELTAIAAIQKLSQGIISVDSRLPRETKEDIKHAFLALNQSAEGRQLLMLYQINTFNPYRPGYLKATEALFAEHQHLLRNSARRRPR
jgi:ABC-type phosphate/phosphonate transport system substrate-binding protein